jgi:hypothetical protein
MSPWRSPTGRPLPPGLEPLPAGFQLLPLAQATAPETPSLFDDLDKPKPGPASDDFSLSAEPYPVAAPQAREQAKDVFKRVAEKEQWQKQKERMDFNGIMWSGIGMMAFAVVWFVTGLYFDILFFRDPPILFIIGLGAFVKGLLRSSY